MVVTNMGNEYDDLVITVDDGHNGWKHSIQPFNGLIESTGIVPSGASLTGPTTVPSGASKYIQDTTEPIEPPEGTTAASLPHDFGTAEVMTGFSEVASARAQHPCFGSVVSRVRGMSSGGVPPYVTMRRMSFPTATPLPTSFRGASAG